MSTKSEHVKPYTVYFHRDKENNYDAWAELGGEENEAEKKFSYMGYEVGLATMVDTLTGECVAYGIYHKGELINFEKEVPLS